MERLLWLLIGYLCGSFQSGYFLGKAKGLDVRNYGSHSTGATNSVSWGREPGFWCCSSMRPRR